MISILQPVVHVKAAESGAGAENDEAHNAQDNQGSCNLQ